MAGMPSDIQAGFQFSVAKRLSTLVASTDVTLTSVFTDTHNNLCMYYAYQAHDAPSAQRAFLLLGPRGIGVDSHSSALPIEYVNIIWQTVVTLSPWQAEVCPFSLARLQHTIWRPCSLASAQPPQAGGRPLWRAAATRLDRQRPAPMDPLRRGCPTRLLRRRVLHHRPLRASQVRRGELRLAEAS